MFQCDAAQNFNDFWCTYLQPVNNLATKTASNSIFLFGKGFLISYFRRFWIFRVFLTTFDFNNLTRMIKTFNHVFHSNLILFILLFKNSKNKIELENKCKIKIGKRLTKIFGEYQITKRPNTYFFFFLSFFRLSFRLSFLLIFFFFPFSILFLLFLNRHRLFTDHTSSFSFLRLFSFFLSSFFSFLFPSSLFSFLFSTSFLAPFFFFLSSSIFASTSFVY